MKKLLAFTLSLLMVFSILPAFSSAQPAALTRSQVINGAARTAHFIRDNGGLPNYVTMGAERLNMPTLLLVAAQAILNLHNATAFSVSTPSAAVLRPAEPAEDINHGRIGKMEYIDLAAKTQEAIQSDNAAPSYINTSLGRISYQSLLLLFCDVLNFFKTNVYLPSFVEAQSWESVSGNSLPTPPGTQTPAPVPDGESFTFDEIANAAYRVNSYTDAQKSLPPVITIKTTKIKPAEFLSLAVNTILTIESTTGVGNVKYAAVNAPAYSMENIPGDSIAFTKAEYKALFTQVAGIIDSDKAAPGHINTGASGTMGFQSLVKFAASVLAGYHTSKPKALPDPMTAYSWKTITGVPLPSATPAPQPTRDPNAPRLYSSAVVSAAASRIKAYIDEFNELPLHVTFAVTKVSMPSFLKAAVDTVLNLNGGNTDGVPVASVLPPASILESVTPAYMEKEDYISLAEALKAAIEADGAAPGGIASSVGMLGYQSCVYLFAELLGAYKGNGALPSHAYVESWADRTSSGPDDTPKPTPTPTPTPDSTTPPPTTPPPVTPTIEPTDTPPLMPVGDPVSIAQIVAAASQITNKTRSFMTGATSETGGDRDDPVIIVVNGQAVLRPAYFILMAKAIVSIDTGDTAATYPLANYAQPNVWSNQNLAPAVATKALLVNYATRNITFATNNSRVPASAAYPVTGFESYNGALNYVYATYLFGQALQYYGANGTLPESMDIPVLDYTEPTPTPQPTDTPPPVTPTVEPTDTPPVTTPPPGTIQFTVAEVVEAASQLSGSSRVYVNPDHTASPGTVANGGDRDDPEFITVSATQVARPAYFILMARAIVAINGGNTSVMLVHNDYEGPTIFAGNTIQPKHATQGMMAAAAQRNITYAEENGRIVAQATFPDVYSGNPEGYSGQFNYLYATYTFSQALQYYGVNGTIPWLAMPTLPQGPSDTPPPLVTPTPPPTAVEGTFTVEEIAEASFQLTAQSRAAVTNGTAVSGTDRDDPAFVAIGAANIPRPAYFILMCKAIDAIYTENTDQAFEAKNYAIPSQYSAHTIQPKTAIPEMMVAAARRNIDFANLNNRLVAQAAFPEYALTGNPGGYTGQFNYLYATYVFAQALQYYHENGELPATVDFSTTLTFSASTPTPSVTNTPEPTTPPPTTPPTGTPQSEFTVAEVAAAASQLAQGSRAKVSPTGDPAGSEETGTDVDDPEFITIGAAEVARPAYFILMARAIVAVNAGNTTTPLPWNNYNMPGLYATQTFNSSVAVQALIVNQATRHIAYVENPTNLGAVAASAGYPHATYGGSETGQINYIHATYIFAQALQHYASNGSLPASIDIVWLPFGPTPTPTPDPTTPGPTQPATPTPTLMPVGTQVSVAQIVTAASQLTAESRAAVTGGTAETGTDRDDPALILVDNQGILRPAFFILMGRAIVSISTGGTSASFALTNYNMPTLLAAQQFVTPGTVTEAFIINNATRHVNYIGTNPAVAASTGYPHASYPGAETGQFNYLYSNYMFAQALQHFGVNGTLPSTLAIPTLTFGV